MESPVSSHKQFTWRPLFGDIIGLYRVDLLGFSCRRKRAETASACQTKFGESGSMSKSSLFLSGASPALLGAIALAGLWTVQASAATPVAALHAGAAAHSEGTVNLGALGVAAAKAGPASAAAGSKGPAEYRNIVLHTFRPRHTFTQAEAAVGAPRATAAGHYVGANGKAISTSPSLGNSFNGLDHADQRNADSGNQFSLEPPDQALAVGHGYVVEAVNNALQVYTTSGKPLLAAPVSMNRFFNQPSEYNRTNGQQGPFLSDPRAYYDYDTGRFFVIEWATLNDASGNPLNISVQFVAVSQSSDPTAGWNLYSYETTNSAYAGCPCFPDFDQLGMDAKGVYITNNLFSLVGSGFVGAVIYVLPKHAMETGSLPIVLQTPPLPSDFTIMPTVIPPHGQFATENKGSEYLVENTSDLTNNGIGTSVNVFAITGTNTLIRPFPALFLSEASVPTQTVSANLPPARQKHGPRPLGGSQPGGLNDPLPLLNPDDGRFSSTAYYVNGTISAASSTAVVNPDNSVGDGVAFYQFAVSGAGGGGFTASVTNQAIYTAPSDGYLLYPAVAMNVFGQGQIGVSVTSKDMFPSTGTIEVPEFASPAIVLSGIGAQPDDGFTAYPQYGGNGVGRWGDYSAGAVDTYGSIWMGSEYIPDSAIYPRTSLANWGTYVTRTNP
ncbi:MAG: hypothetical protein ACR2F8_04195 [Caulobacteraceae bacterium]